MIGFEHRGGGKYSHSKGLQGFALAKATKPAAKSDDCRKSAFTLAEVLITLGIIGVVASMTLPTLLHKIEMAVLKNKFKHAYSILANAFELVKAENEGYFLYCTVGQQTSHCPAFHDQFEKNLKITKRCADYAYQNGCIADIPGIDTVTADPNASYTIDNWFMFWEDRLKTLDSAIIIANGISLVYYNRSSRNIYLIDTNGLKGPNKYGYDIFILLYDNKLMCVSNMDKLFEPGGKSCSDMLLK